MNLAKLYTSITIWIGSNTGSTDMVLHIHAGMAVFLAARLITRRSLATPLPLACVYLAEAFNEGMDRLGHGVWMPDTLSDILYTVFWPTALFLGLRWRRARG
jgi:hypothetical protein